MVIIQTVVDSSHPQPKALIYLSALTLARAWFQIRLYQQGFISVSADEFMRGILALQWSYHPQINLLNDVTGTWLPLEKYLNGLFLLFWPDALIIPRITAFIASSLGLVASYYLAYQLFQRTNIAILTTLLISTLPWYVWLSGTPMLEMYYLACFLASLFFILRWLQNLDSYDWLWGSLLFFAASGLHAQSWVFINLTNFLLLPYWYAHFRQGRQIQHLLKLLALYLISNSFILLFAVVEFWQTGQIFQFLKIHTFYSQWFYSGYDVSVWQKLTYYPMLIYENSPMGWLIVVALGIWGVLSGTNTPPLAADSKLAKFPLWVSLLTLVTTSVFNLFSGPPSAAPNRYALFYLIIFSLYGAFGLDTLWRWLWAQTHQRHKPFLLILFLLLGGIYSARQHQEIAQYPQGVRPSAIETGTLLRALLADRNENYMVELHYWDFLAVQMMVTRPHEVFYDRLVDLYDRHTLSIFAQDPQIICTQLQTNNIAFVAIQDAHLQEQIRHIDLLHPVQMIGEWIIYEVQQGSFCQTSSFAVPEK